MKKGDVIGNFRLESIDDMSEFRSQGRYFIHEKTGCLLYHLYNSNPENLFSFIFRTAPSDNTGAAHIVEHSVLSGSEKYPLKDPFVQLLKSSMYTFLNAMTYPDKTVYPASSTVEADYFNLMSVYGDAVFFPLLRRATFLQEGVRIQRQDDGSYKYSGVVYNEMKGSYSDHNTVLAQWSCKSLFPDTVYRYDSGGVPDEIKTLTYENFLEFHRKNYHPSNCRIFLCGNIDTERQLEFIDSNFLSRFGMEQGGMAVPLQDKMEGPVYMEKHSHSENGGGTTSITMNWMCGDATDPYDSLCMEILTELLIGSSASPLYLALIDSGIGEDLSPVSGLDTDLRQLMFSVGIRGTTADKRDEYEKRVFSCLYETAEKGFDRQLLEGTLRQFEFQNREIKGGRPEGLKLMEMSCRSWLHGGMPSDTLVFSALMEKIRETAGKDDRFFEKILKERLILNTHRSVVTVVPDNGKGDMGSDKILLSGEAAAGADSDSIMFEQYQKSSDSEEDIAGIPVLSRNDIPEKIESIECEKDDARGLGVLLHSFYTAGITYTDIYYDIKPLDDDLKIYLPLFSRIMRESGLPGIPYYDTAKMMNLKTGGLYISPEAGMDMNGGELEFLAVHFKSLSSRYDEAAEFVFSLLREADLDDLGRIRDLFKETVNDLKSALVRRGNYTASLFASRNYSSSLSMQEKWGGITQLFHLQSINADEKEELEKLSGKLKKIRDFLSSSSRVISGITAGNESIQACRGILYRYLPESENIKDNNDPLFGLLQGVAGENKLSGHDGRNLACREKAYPAKEANLILAPTLVSYNSAVMVSSRTGCANYVYEKLLSRIIETGFLWDRIRMDGGAYGVSAGANGMEGIFSFSSYRDPRVEETINIFSESLKIACGNSITEDMLLKAVISSVGKEIRPLAPGEKGIVNARRIIYRIDDSLRQKSRDIMLGTVLGDVKNAAERLSSSFCGASRCTLAGRDIYEKYKSYFAATDSRITELKI